MNVCQGTLTQCSSVYLRVGERALDVNDQRWQEQKHRDGDPAGTIRASESLLQEYSQMREAAEIPTYRKYGARRPPRHSSELLKRPRHRRRQLRSP